MVQEALVCGLVLVLDYNSGYHAVITTKSLGSGIILKAVEFGFFLKLNKIIPEFEALSRK